MKDVSQQPWYVKTMRNSRFWILTIAVIVSVNIAGLIQLFIPSGTLQVTRIEQTFGFISLFLLYVALLASPLTAIFPGLSFKEQYVHARRAIGVSAFYYAFLHVVITFFGQLGGFKGLGYFNQTYTVSFVLGAIMLGILFVMAITSFDWVIKKMGYKKWKLLHRLVYVGSVALIIHIMLIGAHFTQVSVLGIVTYIASAALIICELLRIRLYLLGLRAKRQTS